jgi:hypothetical protein
MVGRFTKLAGRRPTVAEQAKCHGIASGNATIYRAWVKEARPQPVASKESDEVAVFIPFRNNCDFIQSGALRRVLMAVVAGLGRCRMRPMFWLYENDSSDNTPALLQATATWLRQRNHSVHLLSETTSEPQTMVSGRSSARCSRIAQCRNGLAGAALEVLLRTQIALWLDTNVVVRSRDVVALLSALQADPRLGVATGATVMGDGPYKDRHYYDTYAHTPLRSRRYKATATRWSYTPCPSKLCPKPECKRAQQSRQCTTVTPGGKCVVEVESAFGGFAAVRTAAMLQSWWSSESNLCEHVAFCQRVRSAGYRVSIVEAACGQWFR